MADQRLPERTAVSTLSNNDLLAAWTTAVGLQKIGVPDFIDALPIGDGRMQFLVGRNDNGDDDRIDAKLSSIATNSSNGNGALIMLGRFKINRVHIPPDMTDLGLFGAWGPTSCEWYKGSSATQYILIDRSNIPAAGVYQKIHVGGITFTGDWTDSELTNSRVVVLNGYEYARFENCVVRDAPYFGATFNLCERVDVIGCRLYRIARDVINASNSCLVRVLDTFAQFSHDDFVGYNLSDQYKTRVNIQNGLTVAGCKFNQTNGIKVLGARHVKIINNRAHAPRGYFAYVGYDQGYAEGDRQITDVIISNNTISDVLPNTVTGQGAINTAIIFTTIYDVLRTKIKDNIIVSRAVGSGAAFSTMALGAGTVITGSGSRTEQRLYDITGFSDPVCVSGTPSGQQKQYAANAIKGIRIECPNALDSTEIEVSGNRYSGLSTSEYDTRRAVMFDGSYNWTIASGSSRVEFPQTHRITVPYWGTYSKIRMELVFGTNKGLNGSQVHIEGSLDGGSNWTLLHSITLDGAGGPTFPSYSTVPSNFFGQSVVLRVLGSNGNGSTQLTVTQLRPRVAQP